MDISPQRMKEGPSKDLVKREVTEGNTTLGEIQWLATQTSPLLSARCGILLSSCKLGADPVVLKDIQELLRDARSSRYQEIRLQHFDQVRRPEDLAMAVFGDSSHLNRTKSNSTGGILGVVAPPEFLDGDMTLASPALWRSWKLVRRAVGSNDAEVQSIHEAENQLYKLKVLWGELNGIGVEFKKDWVARAAACHRATVHLA